MNMKKRVCLFLASLLVGLGVAVPIARASHVDQTCLKACLKAGGGLQACIKLCTRS
jgi:hypothetical protein